jgi:hypothetical protein
MITIYCLNPLRKFCRLLDIKYYYYYLNFPLNKRIKYEGLTSVECSTVAKNLLTEIHIKTKSKLKDRSIIKSDQINL